MAWQARIRRQGRQGLARQARHGRDWPRGDCPGSVRQDWTGKTWRCKAWHGWRDLANHGLARLDLARLARCGEARTVESTELRGIAWQGRPGADWIRRQGLARQARPCKERWAMRRRSGLTRQGLAVHVVGGTERQARRDRASKAWQDRHCCRFQSTAEWRPDWASQFFIPTTQT